MNEPVLANRTASPTDDSIYKLLNRIGMALEVPIDRSRLVFGDDPSESEDPLTRFRVNAELSGIFVQEVRLTNVEEAIGFLHENHPVIIAQADGSFVTVDAVAGRKFEITLISDHVVTQRVSRRRLRKMTIDSPESRVWVAKRELECDSFSSASEHSNHHHEHLSPLRRFMSLLSLERRDIGLVVLFAFVAGILTLATPLAVESLVNVVSWGTYVQPLIVLGLMLLTCLGLAGVLQVLQYVVVEIIQRRQFVRIVSDLAHRFPRANQRFLVGVYPRELANRVFDIMTIQKATAVLLLDGVTIALTTVLGMVLLAFYHPFLLGFDIVLLVSMISITWLLGRGGIRTAIDESITKYRIVHWLQDVIASPTVFKIGGGESLAIQRANQLTVEYINARQRQFRVVIRQVAFAISLQVIASTAVLAIGGWLVIDGQLTLGQLVASELVVTVIVGAFAKAGKALEKFYDLMAGVDKIGYLIDIPADRRNDLGKLSDGPMPVRWGDLVFEHACWTSTVGAAKIEAGAKVAIVGDDTDGRSSLATSIAGLSKPARGLVQIGDFDSSVIASSRSKSLIGYAGASEVFHGSLRENIDGGQMGISQSRLRETMAQVGLSDAVLRLPDGLRTPLQTGGYPLTDSQVDRLMIARAIVTKPNVVIINGLLDRLAPAHRTQILSVLTGSDAPWTLVIVTDREDVASQCNVRIAVR